MVTLAEMCFASLRAVERGSGLVALGKMCFDSMGAVEKGVGGGGPG